MTIIFDNRARDSVKILNNMVDAFYMASVRDIYLYKLRGGSRFSHSDGWGYIIYDVISGTLTYRKAATPIDKKVVEEIKELIEGIDRGIVMLHTRAASEGTISLLNTQPFIYMGERGLTLAFMHNGSVDKEFIIKELGLKDLEYSDVSDSYLMGLYLYKFMEPESTFSNAKLYKKLSEYTTSSLDSSGLVIYSRDEYADVFIVRHIAEQADQDKRIYFEIYEIRYDGVLAYASSTVKYYLELMGSRCSSREFGSNKIVYLRVKPHETLFMGELLL